ncbi:hypothetical protein [Acetobacter papayae]|uniref:hypothetical protein n=1 Tax=Acetobacter papayae TaxID=1076592 RepID=UPI00046F5636|nr:hypothetical protein [Acetobacter papayae]
MNGVDRAASPTTTEDTPNAPGWVESSLDAILAGLPVAADKLAPLRASYLDCLAGCGRTQDLDAEHDACRKAFLGSLTSVLDLSAPDQRALEQKLEKLELDISSNI